MALLLEELRALGCKERDSVFACHGRVILDRSVDLVYPASKDDLAVMKSVVLPGATDQDLQQLVAACEPAYFGHGKDSVLDATYRQAVMLSAECVHTSFRLGETAILAEIQRRLGPTNDDMTIHATLHKMNVYGPGGFFKKHLDTPQNADTFGTLVVCLASPFEGGKLVIEHDNQRICVDWAEAFLLNTAPQLFVQWAAFYSDCVHEVLPVKSGFRITLTYLLTAKEIMD
ncbi:hypothetical protein Poli38472_007338 [Pythium oligandrum]|uniref:Fe2OG dioxygenase domain-containing protein n=1 Tax=Pythium oligandrum TaxID=41045 RepID=A0A8K1CA22_PYTOL|nr:hypothetical protein Poli38472_007338 [Pythium oligandrum]|eukprot:TMW59193.1 hypothetical protein Poli38472_007338 [Pythium oligandrum]